MWVCLTENYCTIFVVAAAATSIQMSNRIKLVISFPFFCVFCSFAHHSHTHHTIRRLNHVVIVSKQNDNNKNKTINYKWAQTKQNETVSKWHSEFLVPLNTAKTGTENAYNLCNYLQKNNVENDRNSNIFYSCTCIGGVNNQAPVQYA